MSIERLCADVYHYYSSIYENPPEAARIWKKAALEEEEHQKQFELALHLIKDTTFKVSKDCLDRALSIQYKLLKLKNFIMFVKPKLLTAVTKAVEMEEKLSDLHVQSALFFKEESIQNLFRSMSEADRHHIADLQRFHTNL